ncbi:hypothetical protein CAAN1_03S07668 [[Candida] anglica]|uniref:Enoyl reductase (ER) domain-containing protein n=1 Tax=[Candida] anglica TaxID=148631 RepID=A0ABP0EHE5_9ASCO
MTQVQQLVIPTFETGANITREEPPEQLQQALLITAFHEPLAVQSIPIPVLGDHDVLVQNKVVGLNPIDWKGKKYRFGVYNFPWINGRESSGVVVKCGSKVTHLAPNDDVIVSSTSYRDNRTSTFQQYTAIDSRLVWRLPEFLSYEHGATLGVGLVTAGVIMYQSFGFELSTTPQPVNGTILIWGGATVVGIYTIQLAKIAGLRVIAVASLQHQQYLQDLGADVVIDRHLSATEIANLVQERVDYGVDCVSKETSSVVLDILSQRANASGASTTPPLFAGIVGLPKEFPTNVEFREVVIKSFHEDVEYGKRFVDVTTEYIHNRAIQPVRHKSYSGGLHSIGDGLQDLEDIGARAEKYVVSIH